MASPDTYIQERRFRIYRIDPLALLKAVSPLDAGQEIVGVFTNPAEPSLPSDALVMDCQYDYQVRTFAVCVAHPSFSPVAFGGRIPLVDRDIEMQSVRLEKVGDGLWREGIVEPAAPRACDGVSDLASV